MCIWKAVISRLIRLSRSFFYDLCMAYNAAKNRIFSCFVINFSRGERKVFNLRNRAIQIFFAYPFKTFPFVYTIYNTYIVFVDLFRAVFKVYTTILKSVYLYTLRCIQKAAPHRIWIIQNHSELCFSRLRCVYYKQLLREETFSLLINFPNYTEKRKKKKNPATRKYNIKRRVIRKNSVSEELTVHPAFYFHQLGYTSLQERESRYSSRVWCHRERRRSVVACKALGSFRNSERHSYLLSLSSRIPFAASPKIPPSSETAVLFAVFSVI